VSGNQMQFVQRANGSSTAFATVQVDSTLSLFLKSDGPSRAGFVSGPFLIENRGAQPSVVFPGYADNFESGLGPSAPPIPVTLGGLFTFASAIHLQNNDDFGVANIVGTLRFFERTA